MAILYTHSPVNRSISVDLHYLGSRQTFRLKSVHQTPNPHPSSLGPEALLKTFQRGNCISKLSSLSVGRNVKNFQHIVMRWMVFSFLHISFSVQL